MLPFKLIYSHDYYLPIGSHVFPAAKYRLVHEHLLATDVAEPADFLAPLPASDQDILLVHKPDYVHKLKTGTLSPREEMEMEIPYSPELVQAFWLAAGGSISAGEHSLKDRVAFNIGGGFHHAFPGHGEGFCMIHDVAVAIRRMQADGVIRTALIVDTDVHQGNGTAAIFRDDDSVFTLSIHQRDNYPVPKQPSDLDINLDDHTGDDEYLELLGKAVRGALQEFSADLLFYVGGAGPYREDQLGGLWLSIGGLLRRDELGVGEAKRRGIPVGVALAGGYARDTADTVRIHMNTVVAARNASDRGGRWP